jgi:hypothetical protein
MLCCSPTAPAQDYWSTDKERVFLVGATYKQQYQQQQQRQQREQRARSSTTRPRSLFDLSSKSSSSGGSIGSRGGSLSPAAAAAVAAAGELAGGSSGKRQRGSDQVSYSVDESIEELGRLAETAGLQVCAPSGFVFLYSCTPGVVAFTGAFVIQLVTIHMWMETYM